MGAGEGVFPSQEKATNPQKDIMKKRSFIGGNPRGKGGRGKGLGGGVEKSCAE